MLKIGVAPPTLLLSFLCTQVMKIAVAPTVMALDIILFRRLPKPKIMASVFVVCFGIAVATVTDSQVESNRGERRERQQ